MLIPERSNLSGPEHYQWVDDFAHSFVQRWDLYSQQLDDGRYICIHNPLHLTHVIAHLEGKITLGAYLLDAESKARFLVLDADDGQNFSNLTTLARIIETEGIPSYLETSRRGGHLWFFFSHSVPGQSAREFGKGIMERYGIENIELFPKQDKLDHGPGSLIRLPFGKHRRSGQTYGFINPKGDPIAPTLREQIQVLSTPRIVPDELFEVCRFHSPAKSNPAVLNPLEGLSGTLSERIKKRITVLEFISQYVDLRPTGNGAVGLCPFHDDQHPSFSVIDAGNYWNCFAGCGGGSIIDFWMKWKGCNFSTAVKDLAEILL